MAANAAVLLTFLFACLSHAHLTAYSGQRFLNQTLKNNTLSFQRLVYVLIWTFDYATASPLLSHNVEDLASFSNSPPLLRRQNDNGTFAVTGIQNAGVQPRLEIRELERHADAWNLYLLGMQRFQATDQSDKLSYYRICGIHGRPYESWDGVEATGDREDGYCTHVSNIFLTWHRPYLALYEQILFDYVWDAANSFPAVDVRRRYRSAARRWRMPYWDWAAAQDDGSSVYPASITTPTIGVTLPNGSSTIRNPLYSCRFHPVSGEDFFYNPFSSWPETLRYPTNSSRNAASQNEVIAAMLDNLRNSLVNGLFNLFANYNNFTQFNNEAWVAGNVRNADSLESIHDVIHSYTGNNGHMTYLDFSAFEPVFWLHHTMPDRCLSLCQAVNNYTGHVQPQAAATDTFAIQIGEIIGASTPLAPFHVDTTGKMYTSDAVTETDELGYTYPELVNNASARTVIAKLRDLYGSNAVSGGPVRRGVGVQRVSQAAIKQEVQAAPGEILSNGRFQHYVANIVSQKFAMNGSYAIYLFLGDVQSEDPKTWPLCSNMVGTHAVFAGYAKAGVSTSERPTGYSSTKVTGSVPLTDGVLSKVQAGDLPGMSNEAVERYLEKNLTWRVAMMDGTTVVSSQVQPPAAEDQFPSWHNFTDLTSITHGRPGGHRG